MGIVAGALRDSGVQIRFEIVDTADAHPNTYRLKLSSPKKKHSLIAISTGGGMMEVIAIDGVKLSISGDYFETLIQVRHLFHSARFLQQILSLEQVRHPGNRCNVLYLVLIARK